eukprot:4863298-Amphidinium_carterae.1
MSVSEFEGGLPDTLSNTSQQLRLPHFGHELAARSSVSAHLQLSQPHAGTTKIWMNPKSVT